MGKGAKYQLLCRICGHRIRPAQKSDREECGALFRHMLRDKSDECDVEGNHIAEPRVVNTDDGSFDEWVCTYSDSKTVRSAVSFYGENCRLGMLFHRDPKQSGWWFIRKGQPFGDGPEKLTEMNVERFKQALKDVGALEDE